MSSIRIKWIDVAKFFGIFLIFLGHMPNIGGVFSFIFKFHVPLFFFLAGCTDNFDNEKNYFKYLIKNMKKILLPFIFFSIISIVVFYFTNQPTYHELKFIIIDFFNGCIRNKFIAGSLWFLSCLFILKIIFKLIKYIDKKIIILVICIIIYFLSIKLKFYNPSLFFNIDSALYYIIYYCIGYISFDYINKLFEINNKIAIFCFFASGIICSLYAMLLFLGKDLILQLPSITFFGIIINLVKVLMLIWCNIFIAKLFEDVELFNKIGQNTLYLCGNEYISKKLFIIILSFFGIQLQINCLAQAIIYSLLLILIIDFISKYEKRIINIILKKLILIKLKWKEGNMK